uniref:Uncharacterized protein n=1 Tax=Oryza barthii TaxID=65489 RepID=A0A0D3GVX1_9ORYZ
MHDRSLAAATVLCSGIKESTLASAAATATKDLRQSGSRYFGRDLQRQGGETGCFAAWNELVTGDLDRRAAARQKDAILFGRLLRPSVEEGKNKSSKLGLRLLGRKGIAEAYADDEDSMASDSMDEASEEELVVSDMHVVADDVVAGEEVHVVADSMDDEEVVVVADSMDDAAGEEVVVVTDSMDDKAAEVVEVEQNKKVHSDHEFDEIKTEMWKLLLPWYFAKEECVTTGAGDNNDEVIEEERDLHKQKVHSDHEFDEIRTEMLKLLLPSYFPKKRNDSS